MQNHSSESKIFVTSYPYVYERYFKTWDHFPEKGKLTFVLPERWSAKGGKIKIRAPIRNDIKIITTPAYFHHSRYPIIRGLLKGWMPIFPKILKKTAKPGDVLYTAIEPNLLTTYFNSRLAKKLGLKHVFFTWQNIPYKTRLGGLKLKMTERIIKVVVKNSAGAICGNQKAAEILKTYTDPNFKILIAPIAGVDVETFRPGIKSDFREQYGLNEKIILLFAGVLDERKGIKQMLNAFRAAFEKNRELHLVIIGVGPLEDYADQFSKKNNLERNITRIAWLPSEKLAEAMSASDIFIHFSQPYHGWEEQFGYSMAEASACGLPVIATRTGSIEEVVIDGQSGILVPMGDIKILAAAMLKLAGEKELRIKFGSLGQCHVTENFPHQIVAQKFYDFFSKL